MFVYFVRRVHYQQGILLMDRSARLQVGTTRYDRGSHSAEAHHPTARIQLKVRPRATRYRGAEMRVHGVESNSTIKTSERSGRH